MLSRLLLCLTCCGLLSACTDTATPDRSTPTAATPVADATDGLFTALPAERTGVTSVNSVASSFEFNYYNFGYIFNGGGAAVLDFDQDGLQDLFFVSNQRENSLYRNGGDFRFTDVTATAGVASPGGFTSGVTVVDINADGYPDIYLARTGLQVGEGPQPARANELYVNQQDGTFREQAAQYGLASDSPTNHATFFDYDGDGDLDCYLLNTPVDYGKVNTVRATQTKDGVRRKLTPVHPYESDQLLRNDGGTFTDVSRAAGINNYGFALSSLVHDFNGDGRPDLFVANDYIGSDNLYINQGNGTFVDQASTYFRHTSLNSMGSDLQDINNDGLPDLVTLDMLAADPARQKSLENGMRPDRYNSLVRLGYGHQVMRNHLQLNNGNGFSDVGELTGVAATDWSWAPLLADFDHDGHTDLYLTNGYRYDITDLDFIAFTTDSARAAGLINRDNPNGFQEFLDLAPTRPQRNLMYRNRGDLNFEDVAARWNLAEPSYSTSAVYGDLDNDGDLDLVVANHEAPPFVYRNEAVERGTGGNWLTVTARGSSQNPGGVGLRVTAVFAGQRATRELYPVRGFLGTVQPLLHWGLGEVATVDRLEVTWPDGRTQTLTDVAANQRLELNYADAGSGRFAGADAGAKLFSYPDGQRGLRFLHRENAFDDFDRQALLPRTLTREGPALVTGDLTGDGLDDVFFGGAANQPAAIFVQNADGTFAPGPHQLPAADARYEDVDALLFDYDGDGDNDLYVTSGGAAFPNGSSRYQDRLYRNDGGRLSSVPLPRMPTSTGAVVSFDYDGDGDPDLAVGGRSVPGAYPRAPRSYLLQNNGGSFTDVTASVMPDLANVGMVTALAVDDSGARPALVVAGEWMPLTVFSASGNGYATTYTGPTGNWHSLLVTDVSGDGRADIVAGNDGTNSRLRPTADRPVELYAADFDGNGMIDPILTVTDGRGRQTPATTRAQFLKQLPGMKKKFVRTAPYARASIGDIFTEAQLADAMRLRLETVESSVFTRTADGYVRTALPRAAQIAPVRALRSADVDGDGKLDLLALGNDYGLNVETARLDGGNGTLLLGDGRGGWQIPPNREHGFWASLDARRLAKIDLADGKTGWLVANNNGVAGLFLQERGLSR